MLGLLCSLMLSVQTPKPNLLAQYVAKPQPAYSWRVASQGPQRADLVVTSQTWQRDTWQHDVVIIEPGRKAHQKTAYLVVTGDRVDRADIPFAQALANQSGMVVATVFNVPNQPLYERREDDLIAYTFEKYLEGEGDDWPLLLPMVNGVAKAMDAVQAYMKEHGQAIDRFIVTGASKRGWTTWLLAGTGDKRVAAIAPVAFDNLMFADQLRHQMSSWGHLSEMLADYQSKDLPAEAESEGGKRLISLVDPAEYLVDVKIPVMIVRGTNDRYWTADATALYWDRIRAPKQLVLLSNQGHSPRSDSEYVGALAHFGTDFARPERMKADFQFVGGSFRCEWQRSVDIVRIWSATSKTQDFRDSRWSVVKSVPVTHGARSVEVEFPRERRLYQAAYAEISGPSGTSCSTIRVLTPQSP